MNNTVDKSRRDRLAEALSEELMGLSDADALEGQDEKKLLEMGASILANAKSETGRRRMTAAKGKLAVARNTVPTSKTSVADARSYLHSVQDLTMAARDIDTLSDGDLLMLYDQVKQLEAENEGGPTLKGHE